MRKRGPVNRNTHARKRHLLAVACRTRACISLMRYPSVSAAPTSKHTRECSNGKMSVYLDSKSRMFGKKTVSVGNSAFQDAQIGQAFTGWHRCGMMYRLNNQTLGPTRLCWPKQAAFLSSPVKTRPVTADDSLRVFTLLRLGC